MSPPGQNDPRTALVCFFFILQKGSYAHQILVVVPAHGRSITEYVLKDEEAAHTVARVPYILIRTQRKNNRRFGSTTAFFRVYTIILLPITAITGTGLNRTRAPLSLV